MSNSVRHRYRAIRLLTIASVVASILPLSLGQSGVARATVDEDAVHAAVDADASVVEARREQERLAVERDGVARMLDAAAHEYEAARAQAELLAGESADAGAALESFGRSIDAGREEATDRAVAAYLTPSRQLSLAQLVLGAPDPQSALHLAGLIDHLGHRSDEALAQFDEVEHLRRDETQQQYVVTAGAHAVADERLRAAGRLQAALDEAARVVETAERTVAEAERSAAERERERQRREAERRAREEAERLRLAQQERASAERAALSGPAPAVNGRVCPIGSPNGFIDSWGFARSGGRSHKGVDMFAAYGTGLYAVADGVVDTGSNRLGGLTIWLTDTAGHRYYYAHLATIDVADGARVTAGQLVGTNGKSGNAAGTPPHLHWQYHPGGGAAVNPYPLAAALCR